MAKLSESTSSLQPPSEGFQHWAGSWCQQLHKNLPILHTRISGREK